MDSASAVLSDSVSVVIGHTCLSFAHNTSEWGYLTATYLRMTVSPNNIFERYNVLIMNFRNTEEGRFKQE